jgi:hypothetical protein
MATKVAAQLAAALRSRTLVRFSRPFENGRVRGFVVSIGPRFFALAIVSDGIRFDGFQCFRLSDVRELRVPDPWADFTKKALKVRDERAPKKPRVKLESSESLLVTAGRRFPLVTIHREIVAPDICQIGRVEGVVKRRVRLLEIDPGAVWDAEATEYRLSEITRVDFGGDYEEALFSVSGEPPVNR